MNRVTDAIMELQEAAESVGGTVVSIGLDPKAYYEIDMCFRETVSLPDNQNELKKFLDTIIKKEAING